MSKEHTAAPWHGRVQSSGQGLIMGADGQNVAVVYDGEADTALIAAAPELLEALKALLESEGTVDYCGIGECDPAALQQARHLARAAIRSAEGDAR